MPKSYLNLNYMALSLAQEGQNMPATWPTWARYRLVGAWLSSLERFIVPSQWPKIENPPPVFLIGHWRSGTTLLHEFLCSSGHFVFPMNFACLNPQTFLLSGGRKLPPDASMVRPMDDMLIQTRTPQEDEFALFCMGSPSPYAAMLIPGKITQLAARSDPRSWREDEHQKWIRTFRTFAATCQAADPHRPLLFKSPPHGFRISLLRTLTPGARFIQIVRDPLAVFPSSVKLWYALWDDYALAAPPEIGLVRQAVLDGMLAHAMAMDKQLHSPDIIQVRYEDLIIDPASVLARIMRFLQLPDARPQEMCSYIEKIFAHQRKAISLPAQDRDALMEECAAIRSKQGYSD